MVTSFRSFLKEPSLEQFLRRTDIPFALGLMSILTILLLPMPRFLMDFLLAISLMLSVLILMTSLFISRPLDFSAFPTILLVSTLIRLSLNVASTRLILSHGHEGPHAAGKVIQAFGDFVMGGNFVIGLIVFGILVIINFVVITKGSGRIAEVSARFSLDAMPGKQMAIDADLSAGMLDETTARKRRKELELESNFYGAMDGAAKFVRGDAIAGLLITFINIVGGIVIGVVQNHLSLSNALETYTLLTVGDGLVTQIPALIVSTAAGLVVSKSGVEGTADKAIFEQLGAYPSALGMSSALMGILGCVPGIPFIPFLALSGLMGSAAWFASSSISLPTSSGSQATTISSPPLVPTSENLESAPPIDLIRIELGYELLTLLQSHSENPLPEQIKHLRFQMAQDMGIVLPSVRIQDNLRLDPQEYVIRIKEYEAGRGELRAQQYLVMDPKAQSINLPGEPTTEPTFNLPAMWVPETLKPQAEAMGYTVVPATFVLTTHLGEIVKDQIIDLLTYADVQKMLDQLNESYKKLLNDMIPSQLTVGNIQRILQNLIGERVSIRDLKTILEGIFEGSSFSRNLTSITEHVRQRLSRQITLSHTDSSGVLSLVTLSASWEEAFSEAILGENDNRQLALAPSKLQEFLSRVKFIYDQLMLSGESPVLITSTMVRPFVRSVLEKGRPSTLVLSQNEIYPKVRLRNLGTI